MGADVRSVLPGTRRPASKEAWVRWGVATAVVAMVSWVVGVALIPLNAKLDQGDQHLAEVLATHVRQLYVAALLAILGAVLLAGFFAILTLLVPEGHQGGGLLRVSLVGCVITQTVVVIGASFGLAGVHAAAGHAAAGLVVICWRGLWLTFLTSAVPTIVFTVTGVLGLERAKLSPTWVSALGWLSAAAHLLTLFALAQRGAFALDGTVATFVPITTVIWILALAATLPRSWNAAVEPRSALSGQQ